MFATHKKTARILTLVTALIVFTIPCKGQLTSSDQILAFGKESSYRASIPANPAALLPSQTLVTATGPMEWAFPTTGHIYAAVDVPPSISAGQLLGGSNIAAYNAVRPNTVIYEAPNHPYLILTLSSGGTVNVGGTLYSGAQPRDVYIQHAYGRERISITSSGPEGKVTPGVPTPIVFAVPGSLLPLNQILIDFGATVSVAGQGLRRALVINNPANPLTLNVTYPPDYNFSWVSIEAIATTGTFRAGTDPSAASGASLQSTGATLSGKGQISLRRLPAGDVLNITKTVDRNLIRVDGTVTFTYVVTNLAEFAISNVRVWDNQLGDIQTLPSLGPGANRTITRTEQLRLTTRNYATATAKDPFDNTLNARSLERRVEVIDPAVRIRIWYTPAQSTKVGQVITMNYEVSNIGDTPLTNVTINEGPFTANVGRLDVGESAQRSRQVTVARVGQTFRAAATAGVERDPGGGVVNDSDEEILDVLTPAIAVTITADKTKVKANDTVNYTITVTNTGDADVFDIAVSGTELGKLGDIATLGAGQTRTFTKSLTVDKTKNHKVTAVGQDNWSDPVRDEAALTVEVIYPAVNVQVAANGDRFKAKVNKGDKVNFTYVVQNTGTTPLKNVVVRADGKEIARYAEIPAKGSENPPSQELQIDKDTQHRVSVTARDPNDDPVGASDMVFVEVDKGWIDKAKQLLGDGKALATEIEQLIKRFESLRQQFYAGLTGHKNADTDPCADAGLYALLAEAASTHGKIKSNIDALNEILKNPLFSQMTNTDLLDLLTFIQSAGTDEPRIQRELAKMRDDWKALGCGDAPEGKENLVTAIVKVVDKSGAALSDAAVICNGKNASTNSSGTASFVLPLNKGDQVDVEVSYVTSFNLRVTGGRSVTYRDGTQLPVLIVLDTSPQRQVTLSGVVQDRNGRALASASVSALTVPTGTGDDGSYSFTVTAEVGKQITVTASTKTKGGDIVSGSASVVFNGETSLKVPVIRIQEAELPVDVTVSGRVLDANGAGLGSVAIVADGKTATTGANGSYQVGPFEVVSGDKITVNASFTDDSGKKHSQSATATYGGTGKAVRAPDIVFSDIAKMVTITISGQVNDSKGTPLPNAAVSAGGNAAVTGANGRFKGLGPITVESNEKVTVTASVKTKSGDVVNGSATVASDKDADLNVNISIPEAVLETEFTVTGRVVDANGQGLSGATVTIGTLWSGSTTGGGSFTSGTLTAPYGTTLKVTATVRATDGKDYEASASVVYEGGETVNAGVLRINEVEEVTPFNIAGTVQDEDGNPVANAAVSCESASATTNSSGTYALGPIDGVKGQGFEVKASAQDPVKGKLSGSGLAAFNGSDVGGIDITLRPQQTVSALNISPASADLLVGESATFAAIALFNDESKRDVTDLTTWSGGQANAFKATETGSFTLSASFLGASADGSIKVKEEEEDVKTVTAVTVSPGTVELALNESATFGATATFDDESTLDVTDLANWSGGVGNSFTAHGPGEFTVSASYGGQAGNATVTVKEEGEEELKVVALAVQPGSVELRVGQSASFSATANYEDDSFKDVTAQARWNGGTGNSFTATETGSFSVSASYGGQSSSASITVKEADGEDEEKEVTAVSVSPGSVDLKVGQSAAFSATATYTDQTSTDVTGSADWSGGSNNSFTAEEEGSFSISASYGGRSASASINVKETTIDEAIDNTEEGEPDPELCNQNAINAQWGRLQTLLAMRGSIAFDLTLKSSRFFKEVNSENNACDNKLLAAAYAGCLKDRATYQSLLNEASAVASNLLYQKGMCPASASFPFTVTDIIGEIKSLRGFSDIIDSEIAKMKAELAALGCDEQEVEEGGNEVAENTNDPNVIGGGGAVEICGNGLDDDGDGLIDEGCESQGNFNILIIVYDSGNLKDDVFALSVSGQGNLGNTPKGGARSYPLSLSPGSYTATVTVISAPDNVGTFTIAVKEGDKIIASQSGGPAAGTVINVPFTVGATVPTPMEMFEASFFDYETIFFDEGGFDAGDQNPENGPQNQRSVIGAKKVKP